MSEQLPHLSPERIHDLADGLLSDHDASEARAHLERCDRCREAHARTVELVAELGALAREATPPEELWQGIESRIRGTAQGASVAPVGPEARGADVVPLPVARPPVRRFAFTIPQLAAAAALVALLSSGVVWAAMHRRGVPTEIADAAPVSTLGPAARVASSGSASYDQAVLQLQAIVDQGRKYLAPETLATLDRSLQTIDDALAEIHRALAADPGNELLMSMLVRQRTSKLNVLRQAASVVHPTT